MRKPISTAVVEGLQINTEYRDPKMLGFGVRRRKDGIVYFVHKRIKGRLRRITIGRHGSPWTPAQAREEAGRIIRDIDGGGNPATQRKDSKAARLSFGEIVDQYEDLHLPTLKESTNRTYKSIIKNRLLPKFKSKSYDEITSLAVAKAHIGWREHKRSANYAVSVLSSIYSWAENHKLIPPGSNPTVNTNRYKERKIERYLTEREFERLGALLSEAEENKAYNLYAIAAIRLLILSGARFEEVLTLKWEYILWERKRFRFPDSKTGEKYLVLNDATRLVLKAIPRVKDNPFVIVGELKGTHLSTLQHVWEDLRLRAGITDVRLHDLRHTFASEGLGGGTNLDLIGKLLGHKHVSTTARYAHLAPSPADHASNTIANSISSKLNPGKRRAPVALRPRRRSLPSLLAKARTPRRPPSVDGAGDAEG